MNLSDKSIEELNSLYKSKQISVTEVVKSSLDRIKATNPALNSVAKVFEASALHQAKLLDEKGISENDSLMWGIPLALKDNICMKDQPSTCGSRILENFVSPYDSTVVTKLKNANAVLIGNCHMDEFAMGSSCESNAFTKVRNPYDLDRVPGGSSGGSAAAVAANQVSVALGSDTGGSIRQPASFCGVCGIKPTYGLVSRFGLIAYASSLDQIGPFSRSVKDNAILLNAIAGPDANDSTSLNVKIPDYVSEINKDIKGLKIGLPKEYFTGGINPEVRASIDNAKKLFSQMGAELVDISLPHTEYAIAAYYIIATAEASANLARFDGIRYGRRAKNCADLEEVYVKSRSEGFGLEVKRRIIIGTFVLSSGYYDAYYKKAQKVRTFVKNDFENAFKNVDVILTPTSPFTAFKIGEKVNDPISMYLSDIFTVSVNLAGIPAISIPCGYDASNLPIGMQLIGPSFKESLLFNAAHKFEQNLRLQTPKLKV